jgi:hypothetical protein
MKAWVFAALAFFLCTDVRACMCITGSVEAGLANAERVFGAFVVGARVKGDSVEIDITGYASIKGEGRALKKLTTPSSSSGCGFQVSVPERYVFFATKDGAIDRCGATRVLGDPDLGVLTSKVIRMWDSRDRADDD